MQDRQTHADNSTAYCLRCYLGSEVMMRTIKLQVHFSTVIQHAHLTAFRSLISRKSNAQNYQNIQNTETQTVCNISSIVLAIKRLVLLCYFYNDIVNREL